MVAVRILQNLSYDLGTSYLVSDKKQRVFKFFDLNAKAQRNQAQNIFVIILPNQVCVAQLRKKFKLA